MVFSGNILSEDISRIFYCPDKKLIVELDGKIHEYQKEADETRERTLVSLGFRVVRFKNEQVMQDIDTVLDELRSMLSH